MTLLLMAVLAAMLVIASGKTVMDIGLHKHKPEKAGWALPIAFVWTADAGTRALADVVTAAGVTLPEGTWLQSVLAASADGTVLIGTAFDGEGNPKTFVLRVPASAY